MRDQMEHDLRVAVRLEYGAAFLESLAQFERIGDVAVMRDRDQTLAARDREGLRVQNGRIPGRRIARVTNGVVARQFLEDIVGEDVRNMTHRFAGVDLFAVTGRNAGRL